MVGSPSHHLEGFTQQAMDPGQREWFWSRREWQGDAGRLEAIGRFQERGLMDGARLQGWLPASSLWGGVCLLPVPMGGSL